MSLDWRDWERRRLEIEKILLARKVRLKGERTFEIDWAIGCTKGYNPAIDPMGVVIAELKLEAEEALVPPDSQRQVREQLDFLRSINSRRPICGIIALS